MTGLYVIYHDALRQQCWSTAGLTATGRLRIPTIKYVPPPCAMMFLTDLCETLSVDYRVIDKRGATNIIYRVPFVEMASIYSVCAFDGLSRLGFRNARLKKRQGALHAIGGLAAEYVEGRVASSIVSRLEFPLVVWKLQPNGDLRPGTEVTVPVAKYMQVAASFKELVVHWPYPDDLHPLMRHWATLPLVPPVTRVLYETGPDGVPQSTVVADLGMAPLDFAAEDARVMKMRKLLEVLKLKVAKVDGDVEDLVDGEESDASSDHY